MTDKPPITEKPESAVPLGSPERRRILRGLLLGSAMLAASGMRALASGQDIRFFRIGTGATSGTYFPLGGEIASALSDPPGSRECSRGGSCGVPGVIAVAQATQGSVENVEAVAKGTLDSALCQADVAAFAYGGTNQFRGKPPMKSLRALANLYSETLHIVVRADSRVKTVADLRGKRLSLGELESGTLVDARMVLAAVGLGEHDLKPQYDRLAAAAEGLRDGTVDALFQIAGYPMPAVTELALSQPIRLLPIAPAVVAKLRRGYPFFHADTIPADTYTGITTETPTVGIGAQWITSATIEPDFAYALVKALWHENTRRLLDSGHPIGKRIVLASALDGLAIPLHPGAEKFYREIGLLKAETTVPVPG